MKICDFVMPEIRFYLAECNFTEDEEILFLLRTKDYPLESCAEKMNVSIATIERMNKKIKNKIEKVSKK